MATADLLSLGAGLLGAGPLKGFFEDVIRENISNRVGFYGLTSKASGRQSAPHPEAVKLLSIFAALQKQEDEWIKNEEIQANQYSSIIEAAYNGELEEVRLIVLRNIDAINEKTQSGRSALHAASAKGHLEIVKLLVEANLTINGQDEAGVSPLRMAVTCNHADVTQYLLGQKAEPNIADHAGWAPLHSAALHGHSDIITRLIASGADVTRQTMKGYTPLFLSALSGHVKCVKALVGVDTGTNVDQLDKVDNAGFSPLHCAALKGHADIIQILLREGASGEQKTEGEVVPFTLAAAEGHLACVRELMNDTDEDDITGAINIALSRGHHYILSYLMVNKDDNEWNELQSAAWEGDIDLIRSLIEERYDIDKETPENHCTPLILAIWQDRLECAKLLIEEGNADVNKSDAKNNYPLHIAIGMHNHGSIRLLLDNGAQANAANNEGKTPLHEACTKGDLDAIKLLLDAGADINAKVLKEDSTCYTPLQFAAVKGDLQIVRFLVDEGAAIETPKPDSCSALLSAASKNQVEIISYLLANNADLHVTDRQGNSLLFWAALHNNIEFMNTCLDGSDVNQKNSSGQTPLHVSSGLGHSEAIQILLENKADINAIDADESTSLHNASECNRAAAIHLLLDHKAKLEAKDVDGQTPLHLAASPGHIESVEALVERGANINARDSGSSTPLHVAVADFTGDSDMDILLNIGLAILHGPRNERKNAKCVEYLLDHNADINPTDEIGYTPLMNAARKSVVDCAKILISRGANLDVKSDKQSTALHIASRHGHSEIVQLILEKDQGSEEARVRAEAKDGRLMTPLHNAILYEEISSARVLCNFGVALEIPSSRGKTPIFKAVEMNMLEIAELLLSKGVDVNKPADGYNNETPLHAAVRMESTHFMKLLINHGANLDARDSDDLNVFHMAAKKGKEDCLNFLIEVTTKDNNETKSIGGIGTTEETSTPLIDSKVKEGLTPIHFAILGRQMGCLKLLCDSGANIEAQSISGKTPLQRATETKQSDVMKYLILNNAEVNKPNNIGMTALHIAASNGLDEQLAILIETEADVNAVSKDGSSPLHMSIRGGHFETSSILIAHGSDVNAQTTAGVAPVHEAAERSQLEMIKVLIHNSANVNLPANNGYTAVLISSKKGDAESLRHILNCGADVNQQSNHGSSAILLAAEYCHQECVQMLVTNGADPSMRDNDGDSLVHAAALGGKIETLEYVLDLDGIPDLISSKNNVGRLPLHCAARNGHSDCCKLLLTIGESLDEGESGPLINNQDIQGKTPLHLAVEGGFSPVIEALILGDADPNIQTNDGKTSLHLTVTLWCSPDKDPQTIDVFNEVSARCPVEEPLSVNEKLLLYLLDHGANCTLFDAIGNTPIEYTTTHRMWQLIVSRIPEEQRNNLLNELAVQSERVKRTAKKIIGPEGDQIINSRYGVHMTVPPGALDEDQEILMELLDSPPDPGIGEGEMLASFGVRLSPSGLKFKVPVQIRFPHSAKLQRNKRVEMALYHYRDGQLTKSVLASGDTEDTPCVDVREAEFDLYINEFSDWFAPFRRYFFGKHVKYSVSSMHDNMKICVDVYDTVVSTSENKDSTFMTLDGRKMIEGSFNSFYVKWGIADLDFYRLTDYKEADHRKISENQMKSETSHQVSFPNSDYKKWKLIQIKMLHGSRDILDFWEESSSKNGHSRTTTEEDDFEAILITVAEKFVDYTDIDALGTALGFKPPQVKRFIAMNSQPPLITFWGTLQMLRDWREKKVVRSTERLALKSAVEKANFINLASELFEKDKTSADETNSSLPGQSVSSVSSVGEPTEGT